MGQGTKIIAFMSAKGGVGKTSIAVNIANFCAYYKMKVLLVDCDLRTKGATNFLKISKLSLKEEPVITLDSIIGDILGKEIIDDDHTGEEVRKEYDKECRVALISDNLAFIPATRKTFDFANTILFHNLNRNIKKESVYDSNIASEQDPFHRFERYLREIFASYREKYELILLDMGAGGDRLNEIFSMMSDCICVIAEDDKVSLMSVRELKGELWDKHRLEKITPCYNKINEKNKDCQYNKDFLFDPIRGFEYMTEYSELFNSGELLNPEEDRYASTIMAIIEGLGVDTQKVKNEIQKRDNRKRQKERKEQEDKEKLEEQKRQEEEEREEELRKQDERKRQEEEKRQEERKKRELIGKECRRIRRWDIVLWLGILLSIFILGLLFIYYCNRVVVWAYGVAIIFLIILLISGFKWLNFYRMSIKEIIRYDGFDEDVHEEEETDDAKL